MGLIKHNQIEEKGTIVLEKPVFTVKKRPKPTLSFTPSLTEEPSAEIQAEKLIREAEEKAQEIKEKAKEDGLRQGYEEADAKIREALETLNQAVKERKKIVKDSEGEILRLALRVAEQILRSEVSLHRDVILNMVSEAISRVSDREQILVKVNREDAEHLKRYKDRLASMLDGVKSFSVVEDSSVEPGGCVIETNVGYIDARVSTKLKAIEGAFSKVAAVDKNDG